MMSIDQPAGGEGPIDERVRGRIDEALAAHNRGWTLMPMRGKRPILKNWPSLPTPSPDDLERWARQGNLGLRTGAVSGVIVIDDDTDDLSAAKTLDLPSTVTAVTGSGKLHHYFRAGDHGIGNSAGKLANRVDVRGVGGAIVYPGSIHPDTGDPYRWLEGHDPGSIELAEFPEHLVERLRPIWRRAPVSAGDRIAAHVEAQLDIELSNVRSAPQGERNHTLNRSAFLMGRLVPHTEMGAQEFVDRLEQAAREAGLGDEEAAKTARSGLEAGMHSPLERDELMEQIGVRVSRRAIADLPRDAEGRPEIFVEPGSLHEIVEKAGEALGDAEPPIVYQRGGVLVRAVRGSGAVVPATRDAQVPVIVDVLADWLIAVLTRLVLFLRTGKKDDPWQPIDCPVKVVKAILAGSGTWSAPPLLGIMTTPTLRADGSLLDEPGYDSASGLLFDPCGVAFEAIPASPTHSNAVMAIAALRVPLKDFPFCSSADEAVVLAAMITSIVRPSLRTAPLFGISAPTMSSGKTLLADCVAYLATGATAAAMPQGKDEEEQRKRILAILREGQSVVVIDNVEHDLQGSALCAALTSEQYQDRVLGSSRTATYSTKVTWIATGNNLVIKGDLTTRVLVAHLDPEVERPEEREFDVDLRKFIPQHRGRLVSAVLTVLRAYIVAGRPKQGVRGFARFEDWSNLVRSALVWAGVADPCGVRVQIDEADPERETMRMILHGWREVIGDTPMLAAEVTKRLANLAPDDEAAIHFRDAIVIVATDPRGDLCARRLGKWLRDHEGRIEGGIRIARAGTRQRAALWVVEVPPRSRGRAREQDGQAAGHQAVVPASTCAGKSESGESGESLSGSSRITIGEDGGGEALDGGFGIWIDGKQTHLTHQTHSRAVDSRSEEGARCDRQAVGTRPTEDEL